MSVQLIEDMKFICTACFKTDLFFLPQSCYVLCSTTKLICRFLVFSRGPVPSLDVNLLL